MYVHRIQNAIANFSQTIDFDGFVLFSFVFSLKVMHRFKTTLYFSNKADSSTQGEFLRIHVY